MTEIANVFKDGDAVIVKADTTKPNGDKAPQAGQRGVIIGNPKPGRYMVDVAGMPVINLAGEQLQAAGAAPAATSVAGVETPADTAAPAAAPASAPAADPSPAGAPPRIAYAHDVLPLSALVTSLTNPRTHFDPAALQSLADSIASDGLGQAILVRPLPGSRLQETFTDRRKGEPRPTHEIVAGERRFRACGLAGVRTVPVLIRDLTDEQVLRMQLIENVQRENLHPLEEAQGYRRILDLPSQAQKTMAVRVDELATGVKKSTRYIYQTLQLLQLCDFAKKVFLEGNLRRSIAVQIATIGNEPGQIEATRRIAGLARAGTSTEVISDPLSHRQAENYIHNTFRLVLSKAPFNIKIALAGAEACSSCPKMSGNVSDLFEEGAKGPDTCLDPSCYGKKNMAHQAAIAEAAKAKGQKVIAGAAAKKILPYSHMQDDLQGGWIAMSERQYGPGMDGKTLQQLLGKDHPLPTLIENPHAPGFIEALPADVVKRLFKERGIGNARDVGMSSHKADQRKELQKEKAEKAYRWALAEALLAQADKLDDVAVFEDLILPMMIQIYCRLDNEATKRVHKLMGWDFASLGSRERAKMEEHFTALSSPQLNKFIIAACISGELHVAQYYKPGNASLDAMSEILSVDAKALKAKLAADEKAAEKEKADRLKAAAKPATKAAAKKSAEPSAGAMKTTFAVGQAVRFKDGLKGPAGMFRKVCGKAGVISSIQGREYFVAVEGSKDKHRATVDELIAEEVKAPVPSRKTQWREPTAAEIAEFKPGLRVRVDDARRLAGRSHKYAGKVGVLTTRVGQAWFLDLAKKGGPSIPTTCSIHVDELTVEALPATAAESVKDKPTPAAKKAATPAKAKPAEEQQALDLPAPSSMLNPVAGWPFPTAARA